MGIKRTPADDAFSKCVGKEMTGLARDAEHIILTALVVAACIVLIITVAVIFLFDSISQIAFRCVTVATGTSPPNQRNTRNGSGIGSGRGG